MKKGMHMCSVFGLSGQLTLTIFLKKTNLTTVHTLKGLVKTFGLSKCIINKFGLRNRWKIFARL